MPTTFHSQRPEMARRYSVARQGDDRAGPHFRVREFRCKDGSDAVLIHPALVALLETIRGRFQKPVVINSAYRTAQHNRRVGGSPGSKHLVGMAADIRIEGVRPEVVADYAATLFTGGIGIYDTFTHLDVAGYGRRWDHRS